MYKGSFVGVSHFVGGGGGDISRYSTVGLSAQQCEECTDVIPL